MGLEDPFADTPGELEDIHIGVDDERTLGHTTVEVMYGGTERKPPERREFDKVRIKSVAGRTVVMGMAYADDGDRTVALPKSIIPFREVLSITMAVDANHSKQEGLTFSGVGF